jgi:hypothetical protein
LEYVPAPGKSSHHEQPMANLMLRRVLKRNTSSLPQ